jgi:acetyl-CoA acetyltransferase
MRTLSRRVAIIGVGESDEVGRVPGKSPIALAVEASLNAIADAGIGFNEIDSLYTTQSIADSSSVMASVFTEYVGISPAFATWMPYGGMATASILLYASALVESGMCNTILVCSSDNLLSGKTRGGAVAKFSEIGHPDYEMPFGSTVPGFYALFAQRYMHEYNVKPEHLAAVAVAARKHASLNPRAQMRTPISVDDVLNSRLIADPFRVLDCAIISDGACAFIVTTAERARDATKKPVYVLGAGAATTHQHILAAPGFTHTPAKMAAEKAFAMAGVDPSDVDLFYPYDNFTCMVLAQIEDTGFCRKGEAAEFVQDGRIEPGGALPVNTHGGLLSYAHPGRPIFSIAEAVRQLRNEAGAGQVPGAEIAVVNGMGGINSTVAVHVLGC